MLYDSTKTRRERRTNDNRYELENLKVSECQPALKHGAESNRETLLQFVREVQAPNEKVSQGHLHQMAAPLQLEMSMKKQWKKQF